MTQHFLLRTSPLILIPVLAVLQTATLSAQTGVSEDRVSLPEGPGSLEGVGENVDIDTNMGAMSHSVRVVMPKGFDAVTPSLDLSYSSSGGESVVGVGWNIPMPSVERMTFKRLPLYQNDDDFCADGADQLVRQPGTEPAIYRSRFEKGFVRYTWMNEGDGSEGYWIAEYPDGTKAYFGATADGTLVPEARVGADEGTFKYMMVEKVDVYGHREVWTWQKFGHYSLPTHIGWVFKAGMPTYEAVLNYQPREDEDDQAYISSADGGFDLLLTQRLSSIEIKSRSNTIRRYALTYEPYIDSGGFTRLTRVETIGAQGGIYPIAFDFEYSQTLGQCEGDDCELPFMVDMGSTGVVVADGSATLLDINGDALPDIVDASQPGPHRFFINALGDNGDSGFQNEIVESAVGRQDGHRLGQATVQVLDVNGDGFTDLINASTGSVLINKGNGDWEASSFVESDTLAGPLAEDFDADEGGLQSLRFIDFNNDKKIDMMQATRAQTVFFENRGEDGFEVVEGTTSIEAGFEEDNLQLSDMNGDGQLDIVKVQLGSIQYRLNFGWGKWGDWRVIDGLPIGEGQIEIAEMEDINGDALSDLVVVQGESVTYALNNNSDRFETPVTLESEDINGSIPNRAQEVTVLYADMNANGSSDVVWIRPGGQVDYLELFPVRPNLMTRITNGIGAITDIEYTTVAQEMARDGGAGAWQYRLPSPMNIVKSKQVYEALDSPREITRYTYRDGFYDGEEKQFRGFSNVETQLVGDETIEEGLTTERFDVGADDTYRHGLLLQNSTASAGRELMETFFTYDNCPVAELSENLSYPVRHICMTRTRTLTKEGLAATRWIETISSSDFDGYGNVVEERNQGVTSVGGGACQPCDGRDPDAFGTPCGAQCIGDEMTTQTEYIATNNTSGRWILSAPFRVRTFGREGSDLATESLTYYDGADYNPMPLGQLSVGDVTRTTDRVGVGSDRVIESSRNKYDRHGNVIETLDPLGEPGGTTHRRIFTMDEDNLRVTSADILLEDAQGNPYRLRREMTYELRFDKIVEATDWLRVVDGAVASTYRSTTYNHDEFGRMIERTFPGNTTDLPDETFEYDLQSPASRLITLARSQVGQPFDLRKIQCFDGRGRTFQVRTRIDGDRHQVTGFKRFNIRSQPVEVFQPFISESDACDTTRPEGVLSTRSRYDASHRIISSTQPDDGIYGTASVTRTVYEPLTVLTFDQEDSDSDSPHAGTPTTIHSDGQGRTTTIERLLEENGEPASVEVHYDSLGRVTGYTDDAGNKKEQFFDLLGRTTRIIDPNSAEETSFEYDDASNLVRQTDDRGVVTVHEYDGLNRKIATYDEADEQGTRIEWTLDFDADCAECTHTEGQIATISWPGLDGLRGIDAFGFDLRSRQVVQTRTMAGVTFEFGKLYDNANRTIATTYPSGRTIEHRYDDASRLTELVGIVHTLDYEARGMMASMGCADGSSTTMTYDDLMRLESVTTGNSSGVLQGFEYRRDRVGNLLQVTDRAPAAEGRPRFDAEHTYDAWYRTIESHFDKEGDTDESMSFGLDTIDNLTTITSSLGDESPAHVGPLSYDSFAPNAVTEAAGMFLDYDKAGNVESRGAVQYTWDYMNRMTAAEGVGVDSRFVYGPDQSRVAKFEADTTALYASSTFEVRNGISTLYIKIDRNRVARIESDELATSLFDDENEDGSIGAADALLTHDGGGESGPVLWSSVRRLLMETGPDQGTTFLHHDHLGSITLATGERDGEQTVLGHRSFYPLGLERPGGSGYVDEYGFTGQEIDRSTGLLHFDWRYLDPKLGRWLSIDPAFATTTADNIAKHGESTTAYAYVAGNTINANDPTGLAKEWSSRSKGSKAWTKVKGFFGNKKAKLKLKKQKMHETSISEGKKLSGFEKEKAPKVSFMPKQDVDVPIGPSGWMGLPQEGGLLSLAWKIEDYKVRTDDFEQMYGGKLDIMMKIFQQGREGVGQLAHGEVPIEGMVDMSNSAPDHNHGVSEVYNPKLALKRAMEYGIYGEVPSHDLKGSRRPVEGDLLITR